MPTLSTKQFVEVADIREGVLFLKNGSLRSVLLVSSINFELRSEDEQTAIVRNFQQFLNSIDFPLQIVVNSQRFNIGDYLTSVQETIKDVTNELLRIQGAEYLKFVEELATLSNIMSKKFYIVIPFYVSDAPGKRGILDGFTSMFKSKTTAALTDEQFQTYKNQLVQRTEIILGGLTAMGLRAQSVEQDGLVKLFTELYNPGVTS